MRSVTRLFIELFDLGKGCRFLAWCIRQNRFIQAIDIGKAQQTIKKGSYRNLTLKTLDETYAFHKSFL